jgi:hypothetical protein
VKDRADSPYAEDWLKVARRDWHRLHVLLHDDDADGAGFFLQHGGKGVGSLCWSDSSARALRGCLPLPR